MTTKKTTVKKSRKNGVKRGRKLRANENPHPRRLRGKLQLEFKMSAMEVELKRSKLKTTNAQLDTLSMDPQHAAVFQLLRKRDADSADLKDAVIAFAEVQKKVADKFGIPYNELHEYTIDTDNGVIAPSPIPEQT